MHRFPSNDIIHLVGETPRYDLAESLGPNLHLRDLLDDAALGELADLALGYSTAEGDPALRAEIARQHGVTADDVVITAGGMQALFVLAFTLCGTGTEAVAATPLFPLARHALEAVGTEVRPLPLRFEAGYQPDLAELRRLLSPRTQLVSLASPQNPSGVAIPLATLREIVSLMNELAPQAYLLVDETYRDASYGNSPAATSALELGPRVVSTASLSKCHGAPGLRIGWAITRDAALRRELVTAKFNTTIACGAVDEALALKLLHRSGPLLAERSAQLGHNLAITERWVASEAASVDWVRPDAGALCCVRLKPSAFDEAAVERFHAALRARGVRVGDGRWFGESARVFRLGFGLLPPGELSEALAGVSAALHQATGQAVR
jgi:aspartate/methionine/tyrosine aminotransferase